MPRDHRTAELRSIAMHALVAEQFDEDLLASARERVERWLADSGPVRPPATASWRQILSLPRSEISDGSATD